MKKSLLSLLLFAFFSFQANAQLFPNCNPQFAIQFLSANTVKLNPAIITDSPFVQHTWTFGDATSNSNYISPVHTYAIGSYMIKHSVVRYNPNGVLVCADTTLVPISIQAGCNMNAWFYSYPDNITPLKKHYVNSSFNFNPGDSIKWTFSDGTVSYDLNPVHIYPNPGIYTVCLRIKKPTTYGSLCVSEICKPDTVYAPVTNPCNLQAYFTIDSLQPNVFHFNNQSPGYLPTDSIRWSFGDGTFSGTLNPTHTYSSPGTYTACLRIIRYTIAGTPPCIREYCKIITVPPPPCNLTANFTWYRDTAAPVIHSYHFTNTSVPVSSSDSIRWSFGDGTSSNQMHPNHVYAQPGTYIVCLRIQKRNSAGVLLNCVREICKTVIVQQQTNLPPPCTQLSKFNYAVVTLTGNAVTFTPNYVSPDIQYTWTFGDGTGAQAPVATHMFAAPGYYTVCLTAFRNNNCASTTCKSVYIAPNCNNITLGFTEIPDSLVPNRIKFTANSNNFISNQSWKITKLPATAATGTTTINSPNPTYMFLDSGSYRVCLRVVFPGGCVKEYCKIIHISQSIPGTSSCAVQVYPNPTSSIVNAAVTLTQPLMLYAYVYNGMNMQVAQKQQQGIVGNNTVSIPVYNLPAGVYTLRLVYGTQVCSSTFIKQ